MSAYRLLHATVVTTVVVSLLAGCGGGDSSELKLELSNASGIRAGTLVKVGGARVGKVDDISLDDADRVVARLSLDNERVKPGAGARAAISSVNLVGAKFVDLDPGDPERPLKDGSTIPQQRIGVSTELDEVLDLLDTDTRTRLEILLNEAGGSFRGRLADLRASIRGLPPFVAAVNDLLGGLSQDNHQLADLIENSDGAVAQITAERRALTRLVDDAGAAMETVSGRRAALRETLARAPGALTELTRLLRDLDETAQPLGPAAKTLARTAPSLDSTLAALTPFRKAARPTLMEARRAAPVLTSLADRATPMLSEASPVLGQLRDVVTDSRPLTKAADDGIEDVLGLVEGWARTIQARDAVGHAFRGHVTITRDLIDSLAKRLPPVGGKRRRTVGKPAKPLPPSRPPATRRPEIDRLVPEKLRPLGDALERPLGQVTETLDAITERLSPQGGAGPRTDSPLLDFLLGP